MAWYRPGGKPLSESMMFNLLTQIYALLVLSELMDTLTFVFVTYRLRVIFVRKVNDSNIYMMMLWCYDTAYIT